MDEVLRCDELPTGALERLLAGRGLRLVEVPSGSDIPHSYWGAPEATAPTLHKRVRLVMSSPLVLGGQRPIVIISRVFSYDPVKAEFDYERLYGPFGTTEG